MRSRPPVQQKGFFEELVEPFVKFAEGLTILQCLFIAVLIYGGVQMGGKKFLEHRRAETIARAYTQGSRALASMGIPPGCVGKSYCVMVYINPTCETCQDTERTIRAYDKYLPQVRKDVGFGIVIGNATKREIDKKYHSLFPVSSYADYEGVILKTRRVTQTPLWIVHKRSGEEVYRGNPEIQAASPNEVKNSLRDNFGI